MKQNNALTTVGSRSWQLVLACASVAMMTMACGGGGTDQALAQAPAAQSWKAAQLIETDDRAPAKDADVTTDANGNAIAVWEVGQDASSGVSAIVANRYTAAAGWGTAAIISTQSPISAQNPKVISDAQGNAMAVWSQIGDVGAGEFIWAARYTPATGWGAPEQIGTDGKGRFVKIAQSANGDIVAAWSNSSAATSGGGIYANRFKPETGWGTPVRITSQGRSQNVFMDARDNAIVVWQQNTGLGNVQQIRSAVLEPLSERPLVFDEPLSVSSRGSADLPAIASDGSVVFRQSERADGTGRAGLWTRRWNANGTWGAESLVDTGTDPTQIRDTELIADNNGNVTVVWSLPNTGGLLANRYSPSTGWGTPTQITAQPRLQVDGVQLGIDASGKITAVWIQTNTNRRDISVWANQFAPTAGWGTSFVLENEGNSDTSRSPRLSVNAVGSATVVWEKSTGTQQPTDTRTDIWSARFD